MDLLDIDHCDAEVIPRTDTAYAVTADHSLRRSAPRDETTDDKTVVALEMVSEAAAAIRMLEEQSAQAVTRAHDIANAIVKKLELTEARAEHAEAARDQTRAEVSELTAIVARTRNELESTQERLSTTQTQLAEMEERAILAERHASGAEQRAAEANASIERIVEAIRSQLPGATALAPTQIRRPG